MKRWSVQQRYKEYGYYILGYINAPTKEEAQIIMETKRWRSLDLMLYQPDRPLI